MPGAKGHQHCVNSNANVDTGIEFRPIFSICATIDAMLTLTQMQMSSVNKSLEPVYTKHQHQSCNNFEMMLVILFSLKTMELLENGLQLHSRATPLFSMRTELLVSSQS